MTTERTPPGAGFWATVACLSILGYGVSLGPSCWVSSRTGLGVSVVETVYRPILRVAEAFPNSVVPVVDRYAGWGAAPGWEWIQWYTSNGENLGWHWDDTLK